MCVNVFTRSIDLEKHLKETHSVKCEVFECEKCDEKFFAKWRLRKHSEIHGNDAKFCHFFNNKNIVHTKNLDVNSSMKIHHNVCS